MTHSTTDYIAAIAKAIVAGVIAGAAYLAGILGEASTLGDVALAQWLGALVATLSAFAAVWGTPNRELT